jgi:hypothetical protein
MLPQKIIEEIFNLNLTFNDKAEEIFAFQYETNGWYESITFNKVVLWDSEDHKGWLSERPDFDPEMIDDDHDDDVIGCVKRRFNKYLKTLKGCRYDVPSVERLNSEDAIHEILEDMADISGLGNEWESIDSEIKNEIFQKWVHIIEKHN